MGSLAINSQLYFLGGRYGPSHTTNTTTSQTLIFSDLLTYDTSSLTWLQPVEGPERLWNPVMVPCGKTGFLSWGGVSGESGQVLDEISSFNVEQSLWACQLDQGRTVPSIMNNRPPARRAQAVAWDEDEGMAYEFGGILGSSGSYSDELFIYRIVDDTTLLWTQRTY